MEAANDKKRQVKEVLQQKQMQQKEKRFRECNQIGQAKKKKTRQQVSLGLSLQILPQGYVQRYLNFGD